MVETKMLGFEILMELYADDNDFGKIYNIVKMELLQSFIGMTIFFLRELNCVFLKVQ